MEYLEFERILSAKRMQRYKDAANGDTRKAIGIISCYASLHLHLFWWKQPESEEDLLEHRTDGTDAFDTLYIGCEKFPQHDLYPIAVGGVR